MPEHEPDPLETPETPEDMVVRDAALKLANKLKLRDECKFVLTLHEFMEMLDKGVETARSQKERAIEDLKPIEFIQRHAGAQKVCADLIADIKRMAEFAPPKKIKGQRMYE